MKHPSSRDLLEYWERQRGNAIAPERKNFDPGDVRHVLADSFVISAETGSGYPIRAAGTRLCALFGRDLKTGTFPDLWNDEARTTIEDLIPIIAEEFQPTVIGGTAFNDTGFVNLELLILPFARQRHAPLRLTGILAPLTQLPPDGYPLRTALALTSWRHLEAGRSPERLGGVHKPHRRAMWPGFLLYESQGDRN
jgi:hypothetical protein